MGYSFRKFIVQNDDSLVKLRNSVFERLLRDSKHHSMPELAGKRVRVADLLIQLESRRPVCVVRRSYFVVCFDHDGRLDTKRFLQQQRALAESVLDPVIAAPRKNLRVLDAASRFVAQGGRWRPNAELELRIDNAALCGK